VAAATDAHFAVLQVCWPVANWRLQADTVAQKRFEVSHNRCVIGR
jgi:hypothetical protein